MLLLQESTKVWPWWLHEEAILSQYIYVTVDNVAHVRFAATEELLLVGVTASFFCVNSSAAIMCYLAGADFMRSANNVDPVMTAAVQDIGNLTNDIASEIKFTVRNGYGITSQQIKDQLNSTSANVF